MPLDPDLEDLLQGANGVVVIMAGNFLLQFGGPLLAVAVSNFIKPKLKHLRPGRFQFLKAPQPVLLALGLQCGVAVQFLFKPRNGFFEVRSLYSLVVFLLLFKEIVKTEIGGGSDVGFEAFANRLAPDFDPAIIIGVADVLQQVWHFRERTPFSIGGKALFPFALARRSLCICIHKANMRDTKPGYKAKK